MKKLFLGPKIGAKKAPKTYFPTPGRRPNMTEVVFGALQVFLGTRKSDLVSVTKPLTGVTFLLHIFRVFFIEKALFSGSRGFVEVVWYLNEILRGPPSGFAPWDALFSGFFDLNFKKMGL